MKRRILLCVGAVEIVAVAVLLVLLFLDGPGEDDDGGWLREFNDPEAYPVLVPKVDPGVRIPVDLDDAMTELERILDEELLDEIRDMKSVEVGRLHLSLGMWLRKNWELWDWGDGTESALRSWFEERGVGHGDHMSAILLECFWRHLNDQPLEADERLEEARLWEEKAREMREAEDESRDR